MKTLLTILLGALTFVVFGQCSDTLFYPESNIKRIINWADSVEYHFYPSGVQEAVFRLVTRNELTSINAFHLQSKEWFQDGTLKMENRISQDTIIRLTYFANGALEFRSKKIPDANEEFEFTFQSWERYCENGQLISRFEIPKERDVGYEEFHCNGQLAVRSDSTDNFGNAFGIISHFDEDGRLTEIWKTKEFSRIQQDLVWIKKYDQEGKLKDTEYFGENSETMKTKNK